MCRPTYTNSYFHTFIDPREPKNSTLDTSRDTTEIVITGASSSPVEAEAGLIDEFDLDSISPNDGTNDGPVAVGGSLTLGNLTAGTVYTINLKSRITSCSGVDSLNTTTITECTGTFCLISLKTSVWSSIDFDQYISR